MFLDRNSNGVVDDGSELFGNYTPLSNGTTGPRASNGFEALAWFDRAEHGGNGDGRITAGDAVFNQLRVWVDRNHNGISEQDELASLVEAGVVSIDLTAKESRRRDEFGNLFKFRCEIILWDRGRLSESRAFDVYLVTGR